MRNKQIFSQEALDKLRTPERLDLLLPITTPIGWMLMIAIGILLFAVLLWSVFGSFTVKVDGMGLIMDSAGVVNVTHIASGKVTEVYVKTGSIVHKGDLIAHMEQASQSADTRMARHGTGLAANDRDALGRVYEYEAKKEQQDIAEDIISDYDGIVDEVIAEPGSFINSGSPICTVRITQERDELIGLFYIPVEKGKRVEPGMTIQLAPNGVDVSESGSLIGVVRNVSQYPISAQGISKRLGNEPLAEWIKAKEGSAMMEVRFDLVEDKDSASGYLWTSKVGKHRPVTPGSFVTGSIIVDRRPPLEKVFYKFSQWLRSR